MRTVTAQLPDDLASELDKLAQVDGRTRSWLIREALADYVITRREVKRLTMEGMAAVRSGQVTEHDEASHEFDAWGS